MITNFFYKVDDFSFLIVKNPVLCNSIPAAPANVIVSLIFTKSLNIILVFRFSFKNLSLLIFISSWSVWYMYSENTYLVHGPFLESEVWTRLRIVHHQVFFFFLFRQWCPNSVINTYYKHGNHIILIFSVILDTTSSRLTIKKW